MRFLSFQILIILTAPSFGYCIISCNNQDGRIYMDRNNIISAMAEMEECDSTFLVASQGTIEKSSYWLCKYNYKPVREGTVSFKLYRVRNGDSLLLGSRKLYVYQSPKPRCGIFGLEDGDTLDSFTIKKIDNLVCRSFNPCSAKPKITSYSILIIRDTEIIYHNLLIGNIWDKSLLEKLKKNDRILIANIRISTVSGKITTPPFEFIYKK